jgi:hypothetical protein
LKQGRNVSPGKLRPITGILFRRSAWAGKFISITDSCPSPPSCRQQDPSIELPSAIASHVIILHHYPASMQTKYIFN